MLTLTKPIHCDTEDVRSGIVKDETSVSARTRHGTTVKWSFAYKCAMD